MNHFLSLAAIVACMGAGLLSATQARPVPIPTPTADSVRLRALRSAFESARPFPVTQASLQHLVDRQLALPARLTGAQAAQMQQIAQLARRGPSPSLQRNWEQLVLSLPKETTASDVENLMQWVLRETYREAAEDLRSAAEKVKKTNGTKAAIRSELEKARSRTPASGTADASVKQLEDRLNQAGDDAQLANIDFQSALQKAQQSVAMLSEISKLISDTSMAVLRKIGG
ncbi:MAG: hypothetical protein ABI768_01710 [Acidobacteriota bacterium]